MDAKELIENNLRTKDITLDLKACKLTGNEPELGLLAMCSHLRTLILRNNQLGDIEFVGKLVRLKSLDLSYNLLSDISVLQRLFELASLNMSYNGQRLGNTRGLEKLVSLTSLNASHCGINDVTFVGKLTRLTSLDLSYNHISSVNGLKSLSKLSSLNIERNGLQNVNGLNKALISLNIKQNNISDIGGLRNCVNMRSLYAKKNQISDLTSLTTCTNLARLDLSDNFVTDVRPLKKLTKLDYLNLDNNGVSSTKGLEDCVNLTSLRIRDNGLNDVKTLAKCTKLTSLNLSHNEICDINPLKSLVKLERLNLAFNRIENCELNFLCCFSSLKQIFLHENPIKNIPKEILNKEDSLKRILDFLEDSEAGSEHYREVKIILIGNGYVGKTQVARRLVYECGDQEEKFLFDQEHHSTHGIVLLPFRLNQGEWHPTLWDLGGQDLYHATHRLFMQTQALFLLVWDWESENSEYHEWSNKKYKNERLTYWLEYARHFGKGSPILVLQNKADTEQIRLNLQHLPEDIKKYKKLYGIDHFLQVSAFTGWGFHNLKYKLSELLPTVFRDGYSGRLPAPWIRLREELQRLHDQKVVSFPDVRNLCKKYKVEKSVDTIIEFFHDTGFLYYQAPYVLNRVILNQVWLIKAVYKLLDRDSNNKEIIEYNRGQFNVDFLRNFVWQKTEYSDADVANFLDFMLNAELIFEIGANIKKDSLRTYAVPQLMNADKPFLVEEMAELKKFRILDTISYSFLPSIYILRFLVRAERFSVIEYMWQGGMYLSAKEGDAIVEANYEERQILIRGDNRQVVKRVREELSIIANEGIVKPREGPISATDQYWKKIGLKALTPTPEFKKSKVMSIPSVPDFFIHQLQLDLKNEYEVILRYRRLKSNEIDASRKNEYEKEIVNRQQNIKEIEQLFFDNVRSRDIQIEDKALESIVFNTSVSIKKEMDVIENKLDFIIKALRISTEDIQRIDARIALLQSEQREGVMALADIIFDASLEQDKIQGGLSEIRTLVEQGKNSESFETKLKLALPLVDYLGVAKIEAEIKASPIKIVKSIWTKLVKTGNSKSEL